MDNWESNFNLWDPLMVRYLNEPKLFISDIGIRVKVIFLFMYEINCCNLFNAFNLLSSLLVTIIILLLLCSTRSTTLVLICAEAVLIVG